MIGNNGSPFVFRDLKGTNWYRRFIAEEYYIMLDQYPDREIIEDNELTGRIKRTDKRLQLYKSEIKDLFFNSANEVDNYSFRDLLIVLRKIKERIFPEIDFLNGKQSFPALPAENQSWQDRTRFCMKQKNSRNEIWIQQELKEKFEKSDKILFIPGKRQFFELEFSSWIEPYAGEKNIQILCFNNPLYRGVTTGFASEIMKKPGRESIELLEVEDDKIDTDWLKKTVLSNGLIFTTSIWSFLTNFHSVSPLAFSLDNSEWCGRALFGNSFNDSDKNYSFLKEGQYKKVLTEKRAKTGISIAGLLDRPFSSKIDVSGVQYCPTGLINHIGGGKELNFSERIITNNRWLRDMNISRGLESISDFYKITDNHSQKCKIDDTSAVHIASLLIDETIVETKPLFFDSMTDFREIDNQKCGFFSCFNYYFTSNLVKIYNKKVPDIQKLKIEDFFIDYLGLFNSEEKYESLPLYNKAFLGCTAEGSLFSGHYKLDKVKMTVNDQVFYFSEEKINSLDSTGLFLPSFTDETVGENKECLVIIQDQIIYNGSGPCRIPPAGAVIVSEKPFHTVSETVVFSISFKNLPCEKEDLLWMVGGFNLLVDKGVNSYETHEKSMESLRKEGWFLPRSIETQETQLDPERKQPRCVFGKTSRNRLILAVFSGRTEISCGATFTECIIHVNSFLEEDETLDFLINFDGGASASLLATDGVTSRNLSLTAPSAGNPAGVPRRLNAYFSLILKQ